MTLGEIAPILFGVLIVVGLSFFVMSKRSPWTIALILLAAAAIGFVYLVYPEVWASWMTIVVIPG